MKQAPIILISGSTAKRGVEFADHSLSLSFQYPQAIRAVGGLPLVAPCLPETGFVAETVRGCDGVLLTGGDDVAPGLYAPAPLPRQLGRTVQEVSVERDLFELMLVEEVFRQGKPVMAICRGQQILNVALGGTLIVDIARQVPGALNHRRMDRKNEVVHDIHIQQGSELARSAGALRMGVNSSHHQAVEKIAKALRATAVSKDGIVEGLELAPSARQYLPYLLAVQFHPERLYARHPAHLALFQGFLRACRRQSNRT